MASGKQLKGKTGAPTPEVSPSRPPLAACVMRPTQRGMKVACRVVGAGGGTQRPIDRHTMNLLMRAALQASLDEDFLEDDDEVETSDPEETNRVEDSDAGAETEGDEDELPAPREAVSVESGTA
jgi:hypothetical protein